MFDKIRVVIFLIPSEIDLLQQTTLSEQGQSTVERGTGGGGVNFSCHFPQIFCSEMTGGAECSCDNDIALASATQAFFFDEVLETLKNFRVNVSGRCFQVLQG